MKKDSTNNIIKDIARLEREHEKLKTDAERTVRAIIITRILPWIGLGVILLISFFIWVFDNTDPIDDRTDKSQRILRHVEVWDDSYYGFRVVIVTTDMVSEDRGKEINQRAHIRTSLWRLREDAPEYFGGSLMDTDIYDFADYALEHISDPDIYIHNIFTSGLRKDFYIGPNPKIPNSATYMDQDTEQGNLYITRDDIYERDVLNGNIYRYWKCYGDHAKSSTEERFSHFSEEERVKK